MIGCDIPPRPTNTLQRLDLGPTIKHDPHSGAGDERGVGLDRPAHIVVRVICAENGNTISADERESSRRVSWNCRSWVEPSYQESWEILFANPAALSENINDFDLNVRQKRSSLLMPGRAIRVDGHIDVVNHVRALVLYAE